MSLVGLLANTWTEALWFSQLGYTEVFRLRIVTQVILFVVAALLMAACVLGNMWLAYKRRPLFAPTGVEQSSLERYRQALEPLRKVVTIAVPAGLALFAGTAAMSQWMNFMMWWHQEPFGVTDAQFGLDVGFFVYTLPWLRFVLGFAFAIVLLSLLAALAVHYIYGGVRIVGNGPRTTKTARAQLGILLALLMLLRGGGYWLDTYALVTNNDPGSKFSGAGYTDIMAVLPAKSILALIAVIVAIMFIVAAFTGGWKLPAASISIMILAAIVAGGLYPAAIQRFQVLPSEQTKEEKYIQRNIDATRAAYGIGDVKFIDVPPEVTSKQEALREDATTTASIRLMDPAIVSPAFKQLQRIKQYYSFANPLDIDRYTINGESVDTIVAVRELELDGLRDDKRNWVNDHTVYTHGYGMVAAFGSKRTSGGEPKFLESGIPTSGDLGEFEPRVYFGEKSPIFSIVGDVEGASPRELDFPDDDSENRQADTTFQGEGGPSVGNLWNQLLFAIKFRDQNILLSDAINKESQILFDRSPRERVQKVAPWLTLDGDPYPAVVDGRIKWIVDAYTTTHLYPYSQVQTLDSVTLDQTTVSSTSVTAQQRRDINYIRNSVKATVDAYDGKVTLYAWDENDPLLKTWRNVFPDSVKSLSEIDSDLMSHLRYPEDLFKVQRSTLSRYHVDNASTFFSGQDFWKIPREPTAASEASREAQPPYYLTLRMPQQEVSRFSLTSTFIPEASAGSEASVLTGFMAVNADAGKESGTVDDDFGTIRLWRLPRNPSVRGPGQVQNDFNSDQDAAREMNLLSRSGSSSVIRGNLLTVPVGGGLLYVQPVYVQSGGETAYPLLRKVLVLFGDKVGFADTLGEALDQVFGGNSGATTGDADTGGNTSDETPNQDGDTPTPTPSPSSTEELPASTREALQRAKAALEEGQEALKNGDFAAYGKAQEKLQKALEQAISQQDGGTGVQGPDNIQVPGSDSSENGGDNG